MMLTVAGIAGIAIGLYDMFHTLLHPSGQGPLSNRVLSGAWKLSKAIGHRAGSTVGPTGMIMVVLLWVVLQGFGWALVYLPHIPGGFTHSPGVDPAHYPDVLEALYASFTTLSTLGFGDAVPTDPGWVRLAAPLQALTGFALLTAGMTWFVQIYPPMLRRRALALDLKLLAEADYAQQIGQMDPDTASRVLDTLADEVDKVRIDFTQHSEGFYFREPDPDLSLAHQLSHAVELCGTAAAVPAAAVHRSAQRLSEALEQLAQKLKTDFVHTGVGTEQIFAAYAKDHGQAQAT